MKLYWIAFPLLFLFIIGIIQSSFQEPTSDETFVPQSVWVFSVVDSSVGIFEDPETKLTVVDIGTFYGLGGNGTVPDTVKVYRDDTLWKTTTKDTGIAPSTSHSEWQIPQTFFFNELPGLYKIVLFTNNTQTLTYEFLVKQINKNLEVSTDEHETSSITTIISPLKQIKDGVLPNDILCKEGLQLAFKSSDNSPVCIKFSSVNKLAERNWIIS